LNVREVINYDKSARDSIGSNYVRVSTKGGTLMVKCVNQDKENFTDIYLCGPARFCFTGEINV
jgi:diaminopimelate epimerase